MAENLPRHTHNGQDSNRINFDNLTNTPSVLESLQGAPLGAISNPSGGLTIDAEARNAINAILSRLETLNLIES